MTIAKPGPPGASNPSKRPFRQKSLRDLIALIAQNQNPAALVEILEFRPIFCFAGKKVTLASYLVTMRAKRQERGGATELWDNAFDLTVDKFHAMPNTKDAQDDHGNVSGREEVPGGSSDTSGREEVPGGSSDTSGREETPGGGSNAAGRKETIDGADGTPVRKAVDCRHYYTGLLKAIDAEVGRRGVLSPLEEDAVVSVVFQLFVNRHIQFSYMEAFRRANPFVSRFAWRVDGGTITVWMPRYLEGRKRSDWLKRNVKNPDPSRPSERARVQAIINDRFQVPRFVPFETERDTSAPTPSSGLDVATGPAPQPDFARFLAREKAASAERQRGAIRKLSPEGIERLVLTILENLDTREHTAATIATEFNLSKASLSRFCGDLWNKKDGRAGGPIPDLWRNAAEILSQVDAFRDAAAEAGVLKAVEAVRRQDGPARLRRLDDAQ